jgi:hypothetical protein
MLSEVKTGFFTLPCNIQVCKDGEITTLKMFQYSNPPMIIKDRENKIIDKKGFIQDIHNYTFLSVLAEEDKEMFINALTEEEMFLIWRRQGISLFSYFDILKRCRLNNNYYFHRTGYKGEDKMGNYINYPLEVTEPICTHVIRAETKTMTSGLFSYIPNSLSQLFLHDKISVLIWNNNMSVICNDNYFVGSRFKLTDDYYS